MKKYFNLLITLLCIGIVACSGDDEKTSNGDDNGPDKKIVTPNHGADNLTDMAVTGSCLNCSAAQAEIRGYTNLTVVSAKGIEYSTDESLKKPQIWASTDFDAGSNRQFTVIIHNLKPGTTYYYRTFAKLGDTTYHGGETLHFTTKAMIIGNAVDLGLPSGLKWASCNIGAISSEEYGCYYRCGETEPSTFEEYHAEPNSTDVANVKWGNKWHLPTRDDFEELVNICQYEWTTINGVQGYTFSNNGNSIFLPAAGMLSSEMGQYLWEETYGCYLTSTIYSSSHWVSSAEFFRFFHSNSESPFGFEYRYNQLSSNYNGYPVRPVTE